jgi:hypothetical protein
MVRTVKRYLSKNRGKDFILHSAHRGVQAEAISFCMISIAFIGSG